MYLIIKDVEWVTVRDHENDLIYDGWVQAFSDDSVDAELLLRDVSVYRNSTAEPLYQVGMMYVSRKRDDISLEFRTINLSKEIEWKDKTQISKEGDIDNEGKSETDASSAEAAEY